MSGRIRSKSLLVAAAMVVGQGAWLQASQWINPAGGTWDAPENWSGDIPGSDAADVADFSTLDIVGSQTVSLTSPVTLGTILFGDTNTSSAGKWFLDNGGTAGNIITLAGAATIQVNAMGGAAWNPNLAQISAVITGTNGLTKEGAGYLNLTASNTFTGGLYVNGGTLQLNSPSNIGGDGVNEISLNNGALRIHGGNYSNNIVVSGSSGIGSNDGGTSNLTGSITLNGGSTLLINNGSRRININGEISGSGNLSVLSTGTVHIASANPDYSGTTTLQRGVLLLGSDDALGTGNLAFLIANDVNATIASSSTEKRTIANNTSISVVKAINTTIFGTADSGELEFTGDMTLNTVGANIRVNNTTTISGNIAGNGSFTMLNSTGTLILTGDNTYAGKTTINAGTLLVNNTSGSGTGIGAVELNGGTLGGSGAIGGNLTVTGGNLAPGAGNTLSILGNVAFSAGSLVLDINGDSYSALSIGGDVDLGEGVANLVLNVSANPVSLTQLWIVEGAGALSGTFAGLQNGDVVTSVDGTNYTIYYNADRSTGSLTGGNDVVIVVPEPMSVGMFGAAVSLGLLRRRSRR